MTFGQFLDYEYGFEYRNALQFNMIRHQMWASLAAMGGKEVKQPKDILPLWIDDIGKHNNKIKEKEYLSDDIVKKWINSIE
jgi:hypothetical protein